MFITKLNAVTAVVVVLGILAFGGGLLMQHTAGGQPAQAEKSDPQGKTGVVNASQEKDKEVRKQAALALGDWGLTKQGLRMSISATGRDKAGNPEFHVAFENVGEQDVSLNLGMMLANGKVQLPDGIRLNLTDAKGKTRELHFADKRYPGNAGRVDDFVVPLRVGSIYTLKLPLSQFWSPSTKETTLELKAGKYHLSAQFEGGGAKHDSSKFIMNFWEGKLQSNTLTLDEPAPVQVEKVLTPEQVFRDNVGGEARVEFTVGAVSLMGRFSMEEATNRPRVAAGDGTFIVSRLQVGVSEKVEARLKRLGIEDLRTHFSGKVVRVSGKLKREVDAGGVGNKLITYSLQIESLDQLEFVGKK
jgi:hypothetical protein